MKNKSKKVIIGLLGLIAIFFTIGISYALWNVRKPQKDKTIVATDCFNIEMSNGNISLKKMVPLTEEKGLKSSPYNITISNTCKISAEVGITLDILKTTVGDLSKFKIAIGNAIKKEPVLVSSLEDVDITLSDTLSSKSLGSIYVNGNASKTIELRVWLDESVEYGEGEDYVFETKVSLTADAMPVEYNPVQEKIIADNGGILHIRGQKDFEMGSYLYKEKVEENSTTVANMIVQKKYYFSKEYVFNKETKDYELVKPVLAELSEDYVGYYACLSTTSSKCTTMYKIKEIELNDAKESYTINETKDVDLNYISNMTTLRSIYERIGSDYSITSAGQFSLKNATRESTFNNSVIGNYYMANNRTAAGKKQIYRIKEVKMAEEQSEYSKVITEDTVVNFGSANNKAVGKNYSFDGNTNSYKLTETISSVSYAEEYKNYYTCNSNSTSCTTLYKIKNVNGTSVTLADQMTTKKNYNYLIKGDKLQLVTNNHKIILSDKYTSEVDSGAGLYLSEDDFGDTYYFRGASDNNNLYFAGYYWNIIRINGDGSLRLIYRGNTPTTMGAGTQIGTSSFNSFNGDNAYVGYMYGTADSNNYILEHENRYNSTIKTYLENWYDNNLRTQESFIADTIFCSDRSVSEYYGYAGRYSHYDPYQRITNQNGNTPTFKCSNINDRFTVKNQYGNQKNQQPIGLITADEAAFAGLYEMLEAKENYLNTGVAYWTMSPSKYDGSYAFVIRIDATGKISTTDISSYSVNSSQGVRPVINLKGNVKLTGTGTVEDPYIVDGFVEE